MADSPSVTIPDKPAFKANEVCELAQIQPYVLRSWESEFPDLGLSKTPGGPRIYRRVDVERVLRIRDLMFTEGLTLSGVRRQFESEQPQTQDDLFAFVAEVQAAQARATQTQATEPRRTQPRSTPDQAAAPVVPVAPAPASGAPAPGQAAATAVPDAARAQIGRLKQDMRSLLDMLGGDSVAAPAPPAAPAARRARRG